MPSRLQHWKATTCPPTRICHTRDSVAAAAAVAQVSKPAVSPTSKSAWRRNGLGFRRFGSLRHSQGREISGLALACLQALAVGIALVLLTQLTLAQEWPLTPMLPRNRFTSGDETLRAFAPVSAATRHSIVKFNVDGETVALGAVMDTNGLVLTKASELKKGKLTCWLATDREVSAELLRVDEEEDVALVRVNAQGLTPLRWASGEVSVGQWVVTPGLGETPHAVGIISALPHRIKPQRAFIGVRFDFGTTIPKIDELLPGLGAEKAGLQPGDLILAVNSTLMTNREQVVETLSDFRAGQTIRLRVRRAEKEFNADVRLMLPGSLASERDSYPEQRLDRLGGEVSQRAEGFEQAIEHDTVLQPWLCGGPLVNLDGEAIGLNIARAGRVTTYALSSKLVKRLLENLKSMPVPTAEKNKS